MPAVAQTTLATPPAATPPPGTISDFENPPSDARIVYTILSICLSFVTISVVLRVYTRARISRPVWWDDCKYSYDVSHISALRERHILH